MHSSRATRAKLSLKKKKLQTEFKEHSMLRSKINGKPTRALLKPEVRSL